MRTHKQWLTIGAVLVALFLVSAIPVAADPKVIYVDVTWGTDVALCGANPGMYACKTIQYAIDNIAVANDTIMVGAGTYAEDLVVDKANLELKGAGATTVIQGVQTTASTLWPLAEPNIDIQGDGVKAHDFTFKNPAWSDGFYSSGMIVGAKNVDIYNVAFQGATSDDTDDVSQCFQTWRDSDVSGLSVHHNTFTTSGTGAYGYEGIFINLGGTGAVNIHDNTFSGRVIRAITTQRQNTTIDNNTITTSLDTAYAFQGIWVDEANVTVTNNEVKGSSGFGKGIDIGHAGADLHDITLTGNTVGPGNEIGVRVRGVLSGTGVEIHFNNIAGNTTFGVDASAVTGGSLDAESNWWGSKSGPDSAANCYTDPGEAPKGDAVGGDVDFAPWLDAAYPAGSDFAPVALDGAWSYSCIQGAIDDATASTIQTQPGTFTESVLVNKSVDILGAGRGVTKLVPVDPVGFEVVSDTVTIDGFLIDGNGTLGVWGFEVGGLTVSNNDVKDWTTGMLFQDTKGNLDISGNLVHHNDEGIVLHGDAGPSHIVGNEVYMNPVDTGIVIVDSEGALVQENDIHDNDVGLYISASEVDVLGNKILDNVGNGTEVLGDSDVEIHGNSLEGSGTYDVVSALAELGAYLDAECNWWGGGPPSTGEVTDFVDYDPWIGLAVSADPLQVEANGRDSATISGSLVCDGYAVPDGTMVDFATDLGRFTLTLSDVEANVPTVDGVASVRLYSDYAGYATIEAWIGDVETPDEYIEEDRLVTFVPRKPSITYPPHRSTITTRRPTVRWTASPSAVPTLVYELKLKRLRPRPKKWIIPSTVTDQTSFKTPYLRGRVFVVKVRACLDDSLTACSRWRRSKFKIAR